MSEILKKYNLDEGSELIDHAICDEGVKCWFEIAGEVEYRCLSEEEYYDLITL